MHVCHRWRSVVFGSPRRLKLRLVCTSRTPARDTLDAWPALPLLIQFYGHHPIESVDNVIAVLEHSNRVHKIDLVHIASSDLEKVSAAMRMQGPFPDLTHLKLSSYDETVPVLPDSLLGGSAPRLRNLYFRGIPFPGLPNLILSATCLVTLRLYDIPHFGYFSPVAMVTALSMLTSLRTLHLEFQSPQSHPDRESRRPPPPTCVVLPALRDFWFKGVIEYLDDLVARIDAPRLDNLDITFFNQIVFDTPQLIQFIGRTQMLKALKKSHVIFDVGAATVKLSSPTSEHGEVKVKIPCIELDWQVSSLEQVCTSCLFPLSTLEDLYIYGDPKWKPDRQDNIENSLWLDLLRPFTTVKNLYLSEDFTPRIVSALHELVGGGTTEVLPTLEDIFLERLKRWGPVDESIQKFVVMRHHSSRPVAVSRWYRGRIGG